MIKVAVLTIFFLILFVVKIVNLESDSEATKSGVASDGVNKSSIKHVV